MISDSALIRRIKTSFGFLQGDNPTFEKQFFQQVNLVHLQPGSPICHEGMSCRHLALVLTRNARVYKLGETGREITLYRIGPGQSCILTASCILSAKPFPAIAVTEDVLSAVLIPTQQVREWIQQFPPWQNYLFELVSERLTEVIAIVEEIAFKRMDRRICAWLLDKAEVTNGAMLKLTHQALASELGTSREVVSRILKDLDQRQLITIGRGSLSLRRIEALRSIAERT
jgi:CRP/FNR family transcriptional regulator